MCGVRVSVWKHIYVDLCIFVLLLSAAAPSWKWEIARKFPIRLISHAPFLLFKIVPFFCFLDVLLLLSICLLSTRFLMVLYLIAFVFLFPFFLPCTLHLFKCEFRISLFPFIHKTFAFKHLIIALFAALTVGHCSEYRFVRFYHIFLSSLCIAYSSSARDTRTQCGEKENTSFVYLKFKTFSLSKFNSGVLCLLFSITFSLPSKYN